MAFNLQQFKDEIYAAFARLTKSDEVLEDKIHQQAMKLVETDKRAVRLEAIYETDHMPRVQLEARLKALEVKMAIYVGAGSIIGAGLMTLLFNLIEGYYGKSN